MLGPYASIPPFLFLGYGLAFTYDHALRLMIEQLFMTTEGIFRASDCGFGDLYGALHPLRLHWLRRLWVWVKLFMDFGRWHLRGVRSAGPAKVPVSPPPLRLRLRLCCGQT